MDPLDLRRSQELYRRSLTVVPGGVPGIRAPENFLPGEYPVFLATLRTYAELRGRLHAAGLATRTEPVDPEGTLPRFRRPDLASPLSHS